MIENAVILAGGLGTRMQDVIRDIPKPMADINGRPFLAYLLQYLNSQGIRNVILSVGHLSYMIEDYFGQHFEDISIEYCHEEEPLGTGGGIMKAITMISNELTWVFNGDTFFNVDLQELLEQHLIKNATLTIALKPMRNFDRYGTVELDKNNRVIGFREKINLDSGVINGGVYLMKQDIFKTFELPSKFSFEKDLMESHCRDLKIYGYSSNGYFIDIGIPQDYERAKTEFKGLSI
ncbi:MAG: nucleotidyltransferase family protein [Bacteroidetes bacterium]|nr:nucleotidyltransferase family protein [Bacteroidota bacterium]